MRLLPGRLYFERSEWAPPPPGSGFVKLLVAANNTEFEFYRWACALAVVPILWGLDVLVGGAAHRRSNRRTCINCGYDLRASPHRCPECGTPR